MPQIILFLYFVLCAGFVQAGVPTVGEQMRSMELQRQADDNDRWLQTARVLYFENVLAEQIIDPHEQVELQKITDPYRGRFLKPKQRDQVCQLVKDFLRHNGHSVRGFSCAVKGGALKITVRP